MSSENLDKVAVPQNVDQGVLIFNSRNGLEFVIVRSKEISEIYELHILSHFGIFGIFTLLPVGTKKVELASMMSQR